MKKTKKGLLAGLCVFLMATIVALSAQAEGMQTDAVDNSRLEFSTQYPSLVAKAGDSMTFDLDLDNQSGVSQDITLSIEAIPDGWSGTFSAGNKQIDIVHVKNGETNTGIDFALDIPIDAEDGEYEIRLKAQGETLSDEMLISLKINAEEIGDNNFTVEYPAQEGDADTKFSYNATLINNTLSEQSYSFSSNAPAGWQVSFLPAGENTKVAGLSVDARSTQGVDIDVTPPANIEAGEYEITCSATSVSESMEIVLSVTITGSYALDMSTPSGRLSLDAYANKESKVQVTLTNSGNSPLTNVNLTSSAPSGWNVRFENETIELIEAGATIETTAYITPSKEAMSGDYVTILTARNSQANDKIELRITVKTETIWGFVGIFIILALGCVIAAIMKKFGRR